MTAIPVVRVPFVITPNLVKFLIMRRLRTEHPDWSERFILAAALKELGR